MSAMKHMYFSYSQSARTRCALRLLNDVTIIRLGEKRRDLDALRPIGRKIKIN